MLNIRCEALKVSLRDSESENETNCWMAEDAFGYYNEGAFNGKSNPELRKKILIVDDINDTGATFNWIKEDWPSGCLPNDESWNTIWGDNVRFATITENLSSNFGGVRYYAHEVNKGEESVWLVYPWENVGQ
jgi:hypoxanthine phosphoribosyltransferase